MKLQITQSRPPLTFWTENYLSSSPFKNEKNVVKSAQNRRCTSSICEQSIRLNKKERKLFQLQITKIWQPKSVAEGRTDGWSGPTTRPAFAKATQVKTTLPFSPHPRERRMCVRSEYVLAWCSMSFPFEVQHDYFKKKWFDLLGLGRICACVVLPLVGYAIRLLSEKKKCFDL